MYLRTTLMLAVVFTAVVQAAPPPNDHFGNRTPIVGTTAHIEGTTVDATLEGGAEYEFFQEATPYSPDDSVQRSVWYTWTPPTSGTAIFDTTVGFIVATGNSLATLRPIPHRYGSEVDADILRLMFHVEAGTEYQIVFASVGFDDEPIRPGWPFSFSLSMQPTPVNDLFADRIELSGSRVSATGNNELATRERDELGIFGGVEATVWWSWTAPANGTAIVDVSGSSFAAAVAVFTGDSLPSLVSLHPNPSYPEVFIDRAKHRHSFPAIVGTTYAIAVDGMTFGLPLQVGEIDLALSMTAPPVNDLFANRIPLSGANAPFAGTTYGATSEANEGFGTRESVWWSWTAPFSGLATIEVENLDHSVSVWQGSDLHALTDSAIQWDSLATTPGRKAFRAEAGMVYAVMVDGNDGGIGPFSGTLSLVPGPVNDVFADRIHLSGELLTVTGSNVNATGTWPGRNVWWSWTAPFSGFLIVDTNGSDFDTALTVHPSTTGADSIFDHAWGGTYSRAVVPVVQGDEYSISVSGWGGDTGNIVLNLRFAEPVANDLRENAIVIDDIGEPILRTSFGATDVGDIWTEEEGASVWWSWTAPVDGRFVAETTGSDFDTVLEVRTRHPSVDVWSTWSNDDAGAGDVTSRAPFIAEAGRTYFISVAGKFDARGNIVLKIRPSVLPTIVRPPQDRVVQVGSRVVLSLETTSTAGPLIYEWGVLSEYWRTSDQPTYEIKSVTFDHAGEYEVVVRNGDGYVEVSARLTVTPVWIEGGASVVRAGSPVTLNSSLVGLTGAAYQWRLNGVDIPGATRESLELPLAQMYQAGNYSVVVTVDDESYESNSWELTVDPPEPGDARLVNVSTRGQNLSGDDVLITGFAIAGSASRPVLVRTIGPGLARFGVGQRQVDPLFVLKRRSAGGAYVDIAANDNWSEDPDASETDAIGRAIGAFALAAESADAALAIDLQPGLYTAVSGGVNGSQGIALAEIYDASDDATGSQLVNLSTRGRVGIGDAILIAGFAIAGDAPATLLVRGVGPGLSGLKVGDVLADPRLTVYRGSDPVLSNDDWDDNDAAETVVQASAAVGAFSLQPGSTDAALLVALPPGIYTVHVRGKDAASGICLIELYLVRD